MARSRVAIVGSVDESRTFDPPITDATATRAAAGELGHALAVAGWDIVVYSADPMFIEADVVRGYVSSGSAQPSSIHVHAPLGKGVFDELRQNPKLFDLRSDPSRDWEVSYYHSLAGCDGVLLIGGGRSTLVTGLIALAMRLPVVALAAFGGNARKVWDHLATARGSDVTEGDVAGMAEQWSDESAVELVENLERQRTARLRRERDDTDRSRRESRRAAAGISTAAVLLVAAVGALTAAWGWQPGTAGSILVLALAPALTGGAGALVRTALDAGRDHVRAGVLGGAAGLITGLLYVASQLIGAPDVLQTGDAEAVRRLLFFVLPLGFVAGLTFDAVYAKLRGTDVSQSESLVSIMSKGNPG